MDARDGEDVPEAERVVKILAGGEIVFKRNSADGLDQLVATIHERTPEEHDGNDTDEVEEGMSEGHTKGVSGSSDASQDGGNRRTDIEAEDNTNGGRKIDYLRTGETHDDNDDGGGGLDNARNESAGQNCLDETDCRIGPDHRKGVEDFRVVSQRGKSVGHQLQTEKEHTEPHKEHTDIVPPFLVTEEVEKNAGAHEQLAVFGDIERQ